MTENGSGTITATQAQGILDLLQRTQMSGAEMPAYVDIFNTLSEVVALAQSDDKGPEGSE